MEAAEIAARFDERAASYDSSVMHRWQAGVVADFIGETPVGEVLDVGTGTGLALRAVQGAHRFSGLTGVDLSAGMLAIARQNLPNARLLVADATALPFVDSSFDTVFCVSAITYMDAVSGLREWRRVLRPSGRIVLTSPTAGGITSSRLFRDAARIHGVIVPDPNEATGSEVAIASVAAESGLVIARTERVTHRSTRVDGSASFDTHMRYGFGGSLTEWPSSELSEVRATFLRLLSEQDTESHEIILAILVAVGT